MLLNGTLLRLDPPLTTPAGDDFAVRCVVSDPTDTQAIDALTTGVALTLVAYVRTESLPPDVTPEVDGDAKFRLDADGSEPTLKIKRVFARTGRLAHTEIWLAPEGMSSPCPCEGEED